MPPKGSKKTPSCLGTVSRNHGGWRVQATIRGRRVCGPTRLQRSDADADLSRARGARTHEGYRIILKQLLESRQSSGSGSATPPAHSKREEGVVGAGVVAGGLEAAGEASPQARKRSAAALQEDRDSGNGSVTRPAHGKTLSCLGSVSRDLGGWRVQAMLRGRTVCGPTRLRRSRAVADLIKARGAQTYEGYWDILLQLLLKSFQSSPRGRVWVPAHRKGGQASQRDISFDIKQTAVASTNMYRLH